MKIKNEEAGLLIFVLNTFISIVLTYLIILSIHKELLLIIVQCGSYPGNTYM